MPEPLSKVKGGRNSKRGLPTVQLKHLSKSARLEETADPTLSRFIIYTISVVLFALFVWSAFATVPEVARASVPISPIVVERDVQHPIGGTLAQLSAVSGQEVREGDLLAVIDDTNEPRSPPVNAPDAIMSSAARRSSSAS